MREGGKVDRKGRKGKKEQKGVSIETAYHEILVERVASLNLLCLSACAIRASYAGTWVITFCAENLQAS